MGLRAQSAVLKIANMADTFTASRSQVILGVCVPLAVLVGYFLAEPMATGSMAIIAMVFTALCLPLLIRFYHPMMIVTWNAAIMPYFLPGQPYLWMLVAALGIVVAVVNRCIDPDKRFLPAGQVSWALLALTAVLVVTAMLTGGIGTRTFGSDTYGGKKYFYIWLGAAGFFALISRRVPLSSAGWLVSLFFLSGVTALISNLTYVAGQKLYFLFLLFPPEYAAVQASGAMSPFSGLERIAGGTTAGMAVLCFLLARYGFRGIFDPWRPWRLLLLLAAFTAGLLSGYRSFVILFVLILAAAFFLEGLHRTRWLPILVGAAVLSGVLLLPNVDKLPMSAQRALSFLPVQIHPIARLDAESSTEWRLEMWRDLLPEMKNHLLLGRGYALKPGELYLSEENTARHYRSSSETAIIAANFHNGPMSVLIPLGIWGGLVVIWFFWAGGQVLYRNFRYGNPALKIINTALFACYLGRVVFFLTVFGALDMELFIFAGLVGLSVSLNGGVATAPQPTKPEEAEVALPDYSYAEGER